MTRNRKFINSFWETDFNGTVGFDNLCKHIKDGHKTCRDIEEFFKKRAKAEQAHSKVLNTLAKSADGKEESGVLGLSWQELKTQTERIAHFHENVSVEYTRLAEEMSKFVDDLKLAFKPTEDRVKDSQRVKKNAHSKTMDLHRTYHNKCREMEQQEKQLAVANQSVTISTKENEKIKSKADKSREAMEQSDTAYKQAVEVLERARSSWETDMEEACELLQRQEEDRISFVRNQLWKCTNIDSQLCVDWDESCEKVRLCLEQCQVENEILEFLDSSATGGTRPDPILYENYFGGDKSNGKTDDSKCSPRLQRRPPLLPPPTPPHSSKDGNNLGVYSYATPESLHTAIGTERTYKVARTFIPTGNNGMIVRRGDVVKLVGPEAKTGLVKVKLEETGVIGFVPVENLVSV